MNDDSSPEIVIYADGACRGNPGPGGWGAWLRSGEHERELFGGERQTTNNRMELTAAVQGLAQLKRPTRVELVTDSVYVGTGLSEWLPRWKGQGWQRKEKGRFVPIKNEDLWRELARLAGVHAVVFTHVAGHAGHPENERCDAMAVAAYQPLLPRRR
jgi:ribonuclease HI